MKSAATAELDASREPMAAGKQTVFLTVRWVLSVAFNPPCSEGPESRVGQSVKLAKFRLNTAPHAWWRLSIQVRRVVLSSELHTTHRQTRHDRDSAALATRRERPRQVRFSQKIGHVFGGVGSSIRRGAPAAT